MDRETVDVYELGAETYLRRPLHVPASAAAFADAVGPGRLRLDLGCGPGRLTAALGTPVVAADAAFEMVRRVTATDLRVQADLEALPFRRAAFAGTWASKCFQHVPPERLPLALADLHRAMAAGGRLDLVVFEGEGTWLSDGDDDLPGRRFWHWTADRLVDVVAGAGFVDLRVRRQERHPVHELHVTATRGRTLADAVGPGMRLLTCGLNPSLVAADAGIPYARPGNRFWPAMTAAGVATVYRDQRRLLLEGGVGTTDLVKRATVAADELRPDELAAGLARVERLCAWLAPRVLYLVGLAGWRAVVDRGAEPGLQPTPLGGVPVYLAPSTSGRNAATRLETHVDHLTRALEVAARR